MAGHHSVKVALSDEGLGRLHEATERFGMTQMQLVGRLLDWFLSQDRWIQLIAIKQIEEDQTPGIVELLYREQCAKKQVTEAMDAPLWPTAREAALAEKATRSRRRAKKR